MPVIGITGGISTGKTSFCECLRELAPEAAFLKMANTAAVLISLVAPIKAAIRFGRCFPAELPVQTMLRGRSLQHARQPNKGMKTLLLALGIVITGVIVTFSILTVLAVPKELAGSASSIFLGAISYVHKQVDQRSKKPLAAFSRYSVVPLEGFVLPGTVLLCYAILMGLAATQVPGALAGLIAGFFAESQTQGISIVILMATPLALIFSYLVARWTGIRSGANGIWLLLIAFTFVVTVEHLIRLSWPADIRHSLGVDNASAAWMAWISGVIIWNLIALLGFWRGRKIQLRRYADYLLKKVAPETRTTVLSLLREEVIALSAKAAPATAAVG